MHSARRRVRKASSDYAGADCVSAAGTGAKGHRA
jgi:hypothetical protein